MSKYGISVMEILKRTVIVEADNLEEAIQKVEDAVERDEISLNENDFDEREIEASGYWNGEPIPDEEITSQFYELKEEK